MSSLKKEATCLDWGWREWDSGKAMLMSQYITCYSSHQNWENAGLLTHRHHPVRLVASSFNGLYSSVPSPNKIVWNIYYKCSGKIRKNMDILCWDSLRRFCRGEACRSPIRDTEFQSCEASTGWLWCWVMEWIEQGVCFQERDLEETHVLTFQVDSEAQGWKLRPSGQVPPGET